MPAVKKTSLKKVNYAGFGSRFLALLIDLIILSLAGSLLGQIIRLGLGDAGKAIESTLNFFLSLGYFIFYQASTGQTLGKKVMGIKVVNEKNQTPSPFIFFIREFIGKTISAIVLLLGFFMVIWDERKQSLHDKIASTYVVRVRS